MGRKIINNCGQTFAHGHMMGKDKYTERDRNVGHHRRHLYSTIVFIYQLQIEMFIFSGWLSILHLITGDDVDDDLFRTQLSRNLASARRCAICPSPRSTNRETHIFGILKFSYNSFQDIFSSNLFIFSLPFFLLTFLFFSILCRSNTPWHGRNMKLFWSPLFCSISMYENVENLFAWILPIERCGRKLKHSEEETNHRKWKWTVKILVLDPTHTPTRIHSHQTVQACSEHFQTFIDYSCYRNQIFKPRCKMQKSNGCKCNSVCVCVCVNGVCESEKKKLKLT